MTLRHWTDLFVSMASKANAVVSAIGHRLVLNGTLVSLPHQPGSDPSHVLINGTIIQLRMREPFKDSQLNELLYVIIVIVFYATALMTLIVTQIKRQRREGTEIDYYDEYLQRNSEVKSTCRAANSIVSRASHSQRVTTALASAAVAAASAGSIFGSNTSGSGSFVGYQSGAGNSLSRDKDIDHMNNRDDVSGSLLGKEDRDRDLEAGGGGLGGGGRGGGGGSGRLTGATGYAGSGNAYLHSGAMTLHGLGGSGGNLTSLTTPPGRLLFPRDKSPTFVLESIPDEEA